MAVAWGRRLPAVSRCKLSLLFVLGFFFFEENMYNYRRGVLFIFKFSVILHI